jgi:hypothetical protein
MKTLAFTMISGFCLWPNLGFGQNFDTSDGRQSGAYRPTGALSLKTQYLQTVRKIQQNDPYLRSLSVEKIESHLKGKKNNNLNLKNNLQGGVDSGSGTYFKSDQCLGLLDLYLYNQMAFCRINTSASPLPETKAYRKFGLDRLISNNIPLVQKTLNQLQKWASSSPIIAPQIAESLKQLPIYYTSYNIRADQQNYYLPANSNINLVDLQVGAYYIKGFGVFIEKIKFDQVSEENQMALLIHEALRHIQISFASGISNEVVQKLTAKAMMTPDMGETLDTNEFMQGSNLAYVLQTQAMTLRAYRVLNSACVSGFTEFCPLLNMPGPFGFHFAKAIHQASEQYFHRKISDKEWELVSKNQSALSQVLNLASDLNSQSMLGKSDNMKDSAFQLGRAVKFYSLLDSSLNDYNTNNSIFSRDDRDAAQFLHGTMENLKNNGLLY